ncbi:hypothetical protein BBP40_008817 [Aspergillus hancockii]|nr:hypothetical protein BBP40_008817 [Aspergillus hancockii]
MSRRVSKFVEWLARASVQDKFGLCGLLALVCWTCCSLGRRSSHLPLRLQHAVSWGSFFQAPTPGVPQWLHIPSYLQGVLAVWVIASIIVISPHARTWADVQKRAGCLVVTHLVPLCSGFSFSLPGHVYYVGRDTFHCSHRWLARICVLHYLLHGSVLGANARNTSPGAPLVIPFLAGCSIVSILSWTLAAILRRWPQLGLKVHHMLASIATYALFYHLIDRVSSYRWILQFTTHILDTQPVDRIRYRNRNCTRLKYHFHVINIDKEKAHLMDGRGGTTAVSGMSALPFMHFGFARLTGISVRKQIDTRCSTQHRSLQNEW